MRKYSSVPILFFLSLFFLSADSEAIDPGLFHFSLYQGEDYLVREGDLYTLSREPFQIEMYMEDGRSAYLNFSRSDELYRAVREGRDFEEVLGFGGTGMAEYFGNQNRNIILSDWGWHVWKVDGRGDTRFDRTYRKNSYTLAVRTVENLLEMGRNSSRELDFGEVERIYCVVCDVTPLDFWTSRLNGVSAFVLQFE